MKLTDSGFFSREISISSPFFAFRKSSISSNSPIFLRGTAFSDSAISRTATVLLLPFLTRTLSSRCRSSTLASSLFKITMKMPPVAMSISLALSFMHYLTVCYVYEGYEKRKYQRTEQNSHNPKSCQPPKYSYKDKHRMNFCSFTDYFRPEQVVYQ